MMLVWAAGFSMILDIRQLGFSLHGFLARNPD
jgi:hypothetical protein